MFVSVALTLTHSQRGHVRAQPAATVSATASNLRLTMTTRRAAPTLRLAAGQHSGHRVDMRCKDFATQVAAWAPGFVTTRTPPAAIAATKVAMLISPKSTQKISAVSVVGSFPVALTDDARCEAPSSLLRFHSVSANELCSRQPRERSGAPNWPMRRKHESNIYKISRRRTVNIYSCTRTSTPIDMCRNNISAFTCHSGVKP